MRVSLSLVLISLAVSSCTAQNLSSSNSPPQPWHGLEVLPSGTHPQVAVTHTDAQWLAQLGNFAYGILRQAGTEPAFSGNLWNEEQKGTYYSAATGQPLFLSSTKFDSGTGWPSFSHPISPKSVILRTDDSYGMDRIEVLDASSASHLGHVFDDGPEPSKNFPEGTGLRYCMNSASLIFVPDGQTPPPLVQAWLKAHPDK